MNKASQITSCGSGLLRIQTKKTAEDHWESINWKAVNKRINKIQTRITKATQRGNRNLTKKLQYLLTSSFNAKLLAVKKVTSNKGKRTPGVDKQLWLTSASKYKAALRLKTKGYKAKPLRRKYIEKKGKKKKRPLGIPTKYDRAIQALYAMALDPIAETIADKASFGFRKKRGTKDAAQHIFNYSARNKRTQWILEGDIKGCFDNINHQWLLENIPIDKRNLKQMLKAGYIYKRELFSTDTGTPQGGILSPIMANITLDGIEKKIKEKYWKSSNGIIHTRNNKHKVNYTRYADDFIVSADSKETLADIKSTIIQHLAERGLTLSEEKTLITSINDGFDFLGWNFRKYNGKLLIKPSKDSIKNIMETIKTVIRNHRGKSQTELLKSINPIITGWANNHKTVCAKETFTKLDAYIFTTLWRWAKRRHPSKSRKWIKNRYWKRTLFSDWLFSDGQTELKRMAQTKIVRHRIIKFDANPYLPEFRRYYYYRERQRMQGGNYKAAANGTLGE
ncbi:MAG: group II intron reverse transcriptase/maturase [Gammaproteobacteria bacterium]|nr:group II intron reverse transcriptase/maturase [Gammaproteobacteria bacterium]